MEAQAEDQHLVDVFELADALKLPARWLRTEAREKRIPRLRVGRKFYFDVRAVRAALIERAGAPDEERGLKVET